MRVDRSRLVRELDALGVRAGMLLMVHASLRKIGPIEGGADALLDALLEVLGPSGILVMPLGSPDGAPFDALTSPADPEMGTLAEVFRKRRETRVNDHAAARFGAIGSGSRELLEPIPLHDYYGPGSALARFTERGGLVLRLGADLDTVTVTHWAEYQAELPYKFRVRRRYVRADSGEQWLEGLDDCEGIADWQDGDYFAQILVDFLEGGRARLGPVGNCTAELFEARGFVQFAVQWLKLHGSELSPRTVD